MLKGFSISVIGASHVEKEVVCQDASLYYPGESYSIAIVSDGHGSSKHFRSHKGSEIAVKAARDALVELLEKDEYIERLLANHDKTLRQLEENIIYRWNEAVEQDWQENPPSDDELTVFGDKEVKKSAVYGATLIAAVMTERYWFAIQIGDGECITILDDENAEIFIEPDDRLVFGFTTSLCDSNANENFRHYFSKISEENPKPRAIIVSTDGIADSFTPEGFLKFNTEIFKNFVSQDNTLEELEKYLPELSAKGSKDDVSIAGIYWLDGDTDRRERQSCL